MTVRRLFGKCWFEIPNFDGMMYIFLLSMLLRSCYYCVKIARGEGGEPLSGLTLVASIVSAVRFRCGLVKIKELK